MRLVRLVVNHEFGRAEFAGDMLRIPFRSQIPIDQLLQCSDPIMLPTQIIAKYK